MTPRLKTYIVAHAGSTDIPDRIRATCITKAAQQFIATLDRPAKYELNSREHASIRYRDNNCLLSNYVILEA